MNIQEKNTILLKNVGDKLFQDDSESSKIFKMFERFIFSTNKNVSYVHISVLQDDCVLFNTKFTSVENCSVKFHCFIDDNLIFGIKIFNKDLVSHYSFNLNDVYNFVEDKNFELLNNRRKFSFDYKGLTYNFIIEES